MQWVPLGYPPFINVIYIIIFSTGVSTKGLGLKTKTDDSIYFKFHETPSGIDQVFSRAMLLQLTVTWI